MESELVIRQMQYEDIDMVLDIEKKIIYQPMVQTNVF